jgi:hypothetical protein
MALGLLVAGVATAYGYTHVLDASDGARATTPATPTPYMSYSLQGSNTKPFEPEPADCRLIGLTRPHRTVAVGFTRASTPVAFTFTFRDDRQVVVHRIVGPSGRVETSIARGPLREIRLSVSPPRAADMQSGFAILKHFTGDTADC